MCPIDIIEEARREESSSGSRGVLVVGREYNPVHSSLLMSSLSELTSSIYCSLAPSGLLNSEYATIIDTPVSRRKPNKKFGRQRPFNTSKEDARRRRQIEKGMLKPFG